MVSLLLIGAILLRVGAANSLPSLIDDTDKVFPLPVYGSVAAVGDFTLDRTIDVYLMNESRLLVSFVTKIGAFDVINAAPSKLSSSVVIQSDMKGKNVVQGEFGSFANKIQYLVYDESRKCVMLLLREVESKDESGQYWSDQSGKDDCLIGQVERFPMLFDYDGNMWLELLVKRTGIKQLQLYKMTNFDDKHHEFVVVANVTEEVDDYLPHLSAYTSILDYERPQPIIGRCIDKKVQFNVLILEKENDEYGFNQKETIKGPEGFECDDDEGLNLGIAFADLKLDMSQRLELILYHNSGDKRISSYDSKSKEWTPIEVKFPDKFFTLQEPVSLYPIDWSLNSRTNFVCISSDGQLAILERSHGAFVARILTETSDIKVSSLVILDMHRRGLPTLIFSDSKDNRLRAFTRQLSDENGGSDFTRVAMGSDRGRGGVGSSFVNYPGPIVDLKLKSPRGDEFAVRATIIPQIRPNYVISPTVIVGQSDDFEVTDLTVILPPKLGEVKSSTHKAQYTQLIPNVKILLTFDGEDYVFRIYVEPMYLVPVCSVLVGFCFIITIMIIAFHMREKKIDRKEKEHHGTEFNFDAM